MPEVGAHLRGIEGLAVDEVSIAALVVEAVRSVDLPAPEASVEGSADLGAVSLVDGREAFAAVVDEAGRMPGKEHAEEACDAVADGGVEEAIVAEAALGVEATAASSTPPTRTGGSSGTSSACFSCP